MKISGQYSVCLTNPFFLEGHIPYKNSHISNSAITSTGRIQSVEHMFTERDVMGSIPGGAGPVSFQTSCAETARPSRMMTTQSGGLFFSRQRKNQSVLNEFRAKYIDTQSALFSPNHC